MKVLRRVTIAFFLLPFGLGATSISALAQPRKEVLEGAQRCDSIGDDRQWLNCYYGAAQPMRAKLGLSPVPEAQQRLLPAPAVNTGLLGSIIGQAKVADVVATMASYSFGSDGHFTVTLSNGQVWVQSPSDSSIARWSHPARSMTATVSPGAFGSFNLFVKGESGVYKVRRLQ
jgi:hypothetical protein